MSASGLKDFTILFDSEIGIGSFGIVVDAKSKNENSVNFCAKYFRKNSVEASNEVSILSKIANMPHLRNIVKVFVATHATGVDRRPLIVMEKLYGGELFHAIQKHKRFSEEKSAKCLANIMIGLHDLHRVAGIIHRDLKSENIVFASEHSGDDSSACDIKIIDFGHAVYATTDEIDNGFICHSSIGTPCYCSPETIVERRYSAKTDVWSAGVLLYLMLSGVFPFVQKPGPMQTSQIVNGQYMLLSSLKWDGISEDAKHLVERMLTVTASLRITVEEVLSHPWILKHSSGSSTYTTAQEGRYSN